MKIEKLTENKIRIIINSSDLELGNLNLSHFATIALEEQTIFIKLLEKAKKEVGFETEGYKLLVESVSSNDEYLVLTITKYTSLEKKKPIVKRKIPSILESNYIFKFDNFEQFCEFCNCINNLKSLSSKNLSRDIDLYYYQNTYYLLIKNLNLSYRNKITFFSLISEFSKSLSFSNAFENKLIEYGNLIIKKDAIEKSINFFV